jgi:hypothetical protein
MRLLMVLALSLSATSAWAEKHITPEQAVGAVRSFCGDPGLQVVVTGFHSRSTLLDRERSYFRLETPDGASYKVRGTAPVVLSMHRHFDTQGQSSVITVEQARMVAEQFLRERLPQFERLRWSFYPPIDNGEEYKFAWTQVLNRYGALAPWSLQVDVNGVSGQVSSYFRPPDTELVVTLPRISLAQAIRIAARFAPLDPIRFPFAKDPLLEVSEDPVGIQRLYWFFQQFPDRLDTETWYGTSVNAITGEFGGHTWPIGGAKPPGFRRREPPPRRVIALRSGAGELIPLEPPQLWRGQLWVRAEILRAFNAEVDIARKDISLRSTGGSVTGKLLGAEYRDFGWWVPLRRTAESLGWGVHWNRQALEVVVDTRKGLPPLRTGEFAAATLLCFLGGQRLVILRYLCISWSVGSRDPEIRSSKGVRRSPLHMEDRAWCSSPKLLDSCGVGVSRRPSSPCEWNRLTAS